MIEALTRILDDAADGTGTIVVLTGAGISAESGIPTFRGKNGFWTIGSKVYQPQELATWQTFSKNPEFVWPWYLYRRATCRKSAPNPGHLALVTLESAVNKRFILVTQNVDGLHIRAGNSLERTYQIHGNIDFMRCAAECHSELLQVPDVGSEQRDSEFDPEWRQWLTCRHCGEWMRPHVLWFDEMYDEPRYRFNSSINQTKIADLLLIVGTSGATTLPVTMARVAAQQQCAIVDINPEPNPFSELADQVPNGFSVRAAAGSALPQIVDRLISRSQAG